MTRVYLELRGANHPWLQRLAFFTLVSPPAEFPWHVNVTMPPEIDCVLQVIDCDMERFHKALDCYVTYADVIAQTKVHRIFENIRREPCLVPRKSRRVVSPRAVKFARKNLSRRHCQRAALSSEQRNAERRISDQGYAIAGP